MFRVACVKVSVHKRGTCVAGGVHGRGHAWWGACMVGGMHGRGTCMAGGCAWQRAHVARGHAWWGVYGGGHAWRGVCMAEGMCGRGACMAGGVWWEACVAGPHAWCRGACMPSHAPPPQALQLRYTVNERAVRILLECILVAIKIWCLLRISRHFVFYYFFST